MMRDENSNLMNRLTRENEELSLKNQQLEDSNASYAKLLDQIVILSRQREELAAALRACSAALRAEVEARRGHELDRRVDRDLTEADDADELLANIDREPLQEGRNP